MLGYSALIACQQAAGSLFTTYTTAKSVINPQALFTVPAGFFAQPGQAMTVEVWGAISNIVTTPGTIQFQIKMGPTANIVAFDSGQIQLNASAHTTLPFHCKIHLVVDSVGSGTTAKFRGQGMVVGKMFTLTAGQTDDAQGHMPITIPVTAPAVGTGWDSTIANIFDFWAGFSISNVGNGIQIHQYRVTSEN